VSFTLIHLIAMPSESADVHDPGEQVVASSPNFVHHVRICITGTLMGKKTTQALRSRLHLFVATILGTKTNGTLTKLVDVPVLPLMLSLELPLEAFV
jgi:hypothetical protein